MGQLPLTALRAFEVAARHESYTRAAEELRLTHGAISHQVRLLEDELGKPLFARAGQRMRLTPAGEALAAEVRAAFDRLARAWEQVRRPGNTIVVSVLASFASRWLVPRLSRFHALAPEIEVSLRVTEAHANFQSDGVDLGLRFGPGRWPGLVAIELLRDEQYPVCSPALKRRLRLARPADLARAPLLRNTHVPWVPWFRSAGLDWPEPAQGTLYDDSATALSAAVEGLGVALARGVLAADDLATGRLVRLFGGGIVGEWAYYAVHPEGRELSPPAQVFLDWLRAEVRELGEGEPAGARRRPARRARARR